ncbi:MAG TPA: DEAD/DEAH box helicase [Vicinamibacterales bacterium]|nr:DEAD/DEAH box helicase [Vicinamibacterales bacterium]
MPLSEFHPITAQWFTETLGEPTEAQRRGWAAIRERRHTLIAAPTGSGKTLAAFLTALDDLFQEGLRATLPDEVRVVYVSPLKALSADIHKNLAEPRRGMRALAEAAALEAPRITAAVRTGDTTGRERAAMLRTPPHILVTTPESLYLLLTAERSRDMLRTATTVIVDEIHAVIGTRRGAHRALSLERLQAIAQSPLVRIGLSATQKPIEEVARFLVGTEHAECVIVDDGHRRAMDLGVEIPGSPLEAVMSHEVWEEYYARLTHLISEHKTTLVFANTRRMTERIARHLSDRLGDEAVTAHHGSLSKERRLDAEHRLKSGHLKALVATASLELGIDIGHVDLVCQIGSPHRIATLLQRVGRSGHTIAGLPKGRLFPVSRDDLVECAALLRSVRQGELDRIVSHDAPLDVLAQQAVAEAAALEYAEDDLFALVRRAWPYRDLARSDFDAVLKMTADGFATRRGRRSALVHRDEVNGRVRGRRSARLLAITSGGAIPEVADYRVVLDPEDTFIGTVNEDFAIESTAGDIFQLGNASWQILKVGPGIVRVADAKGAPPTLPFWLGEAPARSDELSRAVSDLRKDFEQTTPQNVTGWLVAETGVPIAGAEQIVAYLEDARAMLGVIPTQETLVLERFFDESGGMQLVLHAPFGSRVNKAWCLALRKRFCRQFNFELQAAATEDALLLSLGPQHSFPLSDVFRYLHPATVKDILVQAFLDAPVFQTRWRWNTTISLAVPRNRGGKKVPPQLQRMLADDLMAAVFPDAAACLENIPGDREIPDHPLVNQTVRDCLEEAMDFNQLIDVLSRIHRGELTLVSRDTPEPSPLAHEILNARPYAFLDDAPLEERRAHAVMARRATDPASGGALGALDQTAIERVRDETRPDPRDADELHDVLLTAGFLTEDDAGAIPHELFEQLIVANRVTRFTCRGGPACPPRADTWVGPYVAAERLPELLAIHPDAALEPRIEAPASRTARTWARDEAIVELLRGRLTIIGPTTARELAAPLSIAGADADSALLTLESEGAVLRGQFEAGTGDAELQWCDRRLLARIHRYTLNRLRAEIEPVSPADFMRYLFAWQHVDPTTRLTGVEGLRTIVGVLDGFELAASAWEQSVLPARMDRYDPSMLDMLCLTGEVGWARLTSSPKAGDWATERTDIVGATPIALFLREHADAWAAARAASDCRSPILDTLRQRGALFFHELVAACGMDEAAVRDAIGDLVSAGLVTSDGFAGLRAIVDPNGGPKALRHHGAGRWSAISGATPDHDGVIEQQSRALLRRYGVIFRRLLTREANAPPWRELARVYRRLEARGEIRGGRFVTGVSGEQFALPDAVERLRETRRTAADGRCVAVSAADPLNLVGIVTSGERVRAAAGNRLVYRDGVPMAVLEGVFMRPLADFSAAAAAEVTTALAGRPMPPVLGGYVTFSRPISR